MSSSRPVDFKKAFFLFSVIIIELSVLGFVARKFVVVVPSLLLASN